MGWGVQVWCSVSRETMGGWGYEACDSSAGLQGALVFGGGLSSPAGRLAEDVRLVRCWLLADQVVFYKGVCRWVPLHQATGWVHLTTWLSRRCCCCRSCCRCCYNRCRCCCCCCCRAAATTTAASVAIATTASAVAAAAAATTASRGAACSTPLHGRCLHVVHAGGCSICPLLHEQLKRGAEGRRNVGAQGS